MDHLLGKGGTSGGFRQFNGIRCRTARLTPIPTSATLAAMPPRTSRLYRTALRLGFGVMPIAGLVSKKAARGHRARSEVLDRLRGWAREHRDRTRPLVWFHAPSVGEGLQAESVVARLRTRHPQWQFVFTFFSPSAEPLARKLGADFADYLPYDLPRHAAASLDAIEPDALVFAKLDLWPELATQAAARGVPVALVAATVRPASSRLRFPARQLLAPGYEVLSAAGAISEADAQRLARLGAPRGRVRVLGDPRYDSVVDRIAHVLPDDPVLHLGAGAPTLVAGSTWPTDEAVLLDAFARLHVHRPDARLIVVPHEPTSDHLAAIERLAARLGLGRPVRLSAATGAAPLLIVDQLGVLAKLYGAGSLAYVGGGFRRAGLHSVLEPAAWGKPVIFGPRWNQSRDAGLLLQAGGAEALWTWEPEQAAQALLTLWERWITDESSRAAQGREARRVVAEGAGAAERSAAMVEGLVKKGRGGS